MLVGNVIFADAARLANDEEKFPLIIALESAFAALANAVVELVLELVENEMTYDIIVAGITGASLGCMIDGDKLKDTVGLGDEVDGRMLVLNRVGEKVSGKEDGIFESNRVGEYVDGKKVGIFVGVNVELCNENAVGSNEMVESLRNLFADQSNHKLLALHELAFTAVADSTVTTAEFNPTLDPGGVNESKTASLKDSTVASLLN